MAKTAPAAEATLDRQLAAALPTRATSDGTLRRLQEAALTLFAERGYHGVSMRELAAATGVQAASLYEHMPSKERLLFDLVLLAHTEHRDRIRAALLDAGADTADRLARVVRAHVALHAEFPLLATVANSELHALSEANLSEVRAVRGEAEDTIFALVDRGMRQGHFDCPDAWLATAAIGGMGIRVAAWFRPGGSYTVDEVCDTYAELALRIVGAGSARTSISRR